MSSNASRPCLAILLLSVTIWGVHLIANAGESIADHPAVRIADFKLSNDFKILSFSLKNESDKIIRMSPHVDLATRSQDGKTSSPHFVLENVIRVGVVFTGLPGSHFLSVGRGQELAPIEIGPGESKVIDLQQVKALSQFAQQSEEAVIEITNSGRVIDSMSIQRVGNMWKIKSKEN